LTTIESIQKMLETTDPWMESGGVHWLAATALGVRQVAAVMNAVRARFVTITAIESAGDHALRLEYLWDLDGQLLGIYDLCEAVDWIEREVHEGFAIDFLGRDYEPLLLRAGDKPGVNLHEDIL